MLIAISFLINIFMIAFIFLNLQVIQAPITTINMDIIDINSEEAIIETVLDIYNPNDFDLITRNINIVATTIDGKEISQASAEGGIIAPLKSKTISSISTVRYDGENPDTLKVILTGEVGIIIGFIEKSLPFSTNIITSFGELVNNLVSPNIDITIDFKEITKNNVSILCILNLYNPNSFNVSLKDIAVNVFNEENEHIGSMILPDSVIIASKTTAITGNGSIDIEALNAKELIVNLTSNIIGHIAGYDKSIPIQIKTTIIVPDIKTLLPSTLPTDAVIYSEYRPTSEGLMSEITLVLHNPNNIDFHVKEIIIEINRIDQDTKRNIGKGTMENGLLKANNSTALKGFIIIPYNKIFIPPAGCSFLPDWLEVSIRANVSIQGLNNYLWIGMIVYQDLHLFKKDTFYTNPEPIEWK